MNYAYNPTKEKYGMPNALVFRIKYLYNIEAKLFDQKPTKQIKKNYLKKLLKDN